MKTTIDIITINKNSGTIQFLRWNDVTHKYSGRIYRPTAASKFRVLGQCASLDLQVCAPLNIYHR